MKTKQQILERMAIYRIEGGGIGSWLTELTCDAVFDRLGQIDSQPLPAVQLNQLLVLAHEAPVSDGFFRYYWLDTPKLHPYNVSALPDFQITWQTTDVIESLDHLAWGLHRLYIDGLLYFGNVRTAFRTLREFSVIELQEFFSAKCIDTDAIKRRGPPLPLKSIDKAKRYLISEMACKSYGENAQIKSHLRTALIEAYAAHAVGGAEAITIRALIESHLPAPHKQSRDSLFFAASEILDQSVASQQDLDRHYGSVARRFEDARRDALLNTQYYLSMLTDLDVYVATSMRTPEHFVRMAETCESVFSDKKLKAMNLRYFDPTLSAANGHEDKGLIECLMVKCAKALVYCGGEKESYGKDAEAAMALSLGRPVIFYCEQRAQFYREVHPLTRLIDFATGVAVGAMVTDRLEEVTELLSRIFENRMIYRLERSPSGSLRLKEGVTGSVVRLQTSDKLLSETFWNHYHQDRTRRPVRSVVVAEEAKPRLRPVGVGARVAQVQSELQLPDTANLMRLAARSAAQGSPPVDVHEQGVQESPPPPIRSKATFPMSAAEVFDGISKTKLARTTGAKRFRVFSEWLGTEGIDIVEGLKLLRFIEATLDASGARASYVYKAADLTRWYREMSAGEIVGTRR
jgi:hypothetical protein